MPLATIRLVGCDDETKFDIRLTEAELETVKWLQLYSNATSRCACQPKIFFTVKEETPDGKDAAD